MTTQSDAGVRRYSQTNADRFSADRSETRDVEVGFTKNLGFRILKTYKPQKSDF